MDAAGGNPFATALIKAVSTTALPFTELLTKVQKQTDRATEGFQKPQFTIPDSMAGWQLHTSTKLGKDSRVALVLVVSDYSATRWKSLEGAAWDERRVSAMLAEQGFSVHQGVGPSRGAIQKALRDFRLWSAGHDSAAIYCTGHGLMVGDETFLLPGSRFDPTVETGARWVARHGISVTRIADVARARQHNVCFFAGCRRQAHRDA
ncbi:caspase family protein [Terrabacter sp. Root181]|uniref:caspase family protein n=1 Tax=Terrabacter sp. Root181 TaxID=1736484 RepID=UPI0006F3918C|nr:caspase family protein [Terrabacter sp. Root181]KRB43024.1 hypothetical protein ASD90_21800 [Terrabacter sp. Root181]